MQIDFEVSGGGTVYLFKPLIRVAYAWVDEHPPDYATWVGGAGAVEYRFISEIIRGAVADGLRVR